MRLSINTINGFQKSIYRNDVWFYIVGTGGPFGTLAGWMKVLDKNIKDRFVAHPAEGPACSFDNPHNAEAYFIKQNHI